MILCIVMPTDEVFWGFGFCVCVGGGGLRILVLYFFPGMQNIKIFVKTMKTSYGAYIFWNDSDNDYCIASGRLI